MNKKILSTVALACILSCAPQSASASSILSSLPPQVTNLLNSALGVINDNGKFCGKGGIFSGKVNIRAGEGILCGYSPFGYLAEKKCRGVGDFDGSKCDQKIQSGYRGRSPAQAILEDVPLLPSPVRTAYCLKVKNLGPEFAAACAATAPVRSNMPLGSGAAINNSSNIPPAPPMNMNNSTKPLSKFEQDLQNAKNKLKKTQ